MLLNAFWGLRLNDVFDSLKKVMLNYNLQMDSLLQNYSFKIIF